MALATVSAIKTHMGIVGSVQDAKLTQILTGLEGWAKRVAKSNGLILEQEEIDAYLDGSGTLRLFLPFRPAAEVETVWISADQDWVDANKAAASTYRIYSKMGLLKRPEPYIWTAGVQNVRVAYTAGEVSVDPGLTMAIITSVAYITGQAGKEGLESEQLGDYSYTMRKIEGNNSPIQSWLSPYINPLVVA